MVLVPWRALSRAGFVDRDRYMETFSQPSSISTSLSDGWIEAATREILWDALVRHSIALLGSVDAVFTLITFLSSFVAAWYVVRVSARPWAPLILANPIFVDLVQSQLRMALAVALLLVAHELLGRVGLVAAALVLPMIHTGIVLLIGTLVFLEWLRTHSRFASSLSLLALAAVAVFLVVALGPMKYELLSLIGDRRATSSPSGSSVEYALFWAGLAGAVALGSKSYLRRIEPGVAFILSTAFFGLSIVNAYGSRLIAIAMPFIAVALAEMQGGRRILTLTVYWLYVAQLWLLWLRL